MIFPLRLDEMGCEDIDLDDLSMGQVDAIRGFESELDLDDSEPANSESFDTSVEILSEISETSGDREYNSIMSEVARRRSMLLSRPSPI